MIRIVLIFTSLIFSFTAYSQTQGDALESYYQKGKSYVGFDFGLQSGGAITNSRLPLLSINTRTTVNYQYYILDRLAIGGSISNDLSFEHRNLTAANTPSINLINRPSISMLVKYHPFKRSGFFIESEVKNEFSFFPNSPPFQELKLGINPGYTFMVGKNNNIPIELKMNTSFSYANRVFQFGMTPTIGIKIPLGKTKIPTN